MTCIVYNIKTKKELRERLAAGHCVTIEDPSIFKPRSFLSTDMTVGQREVVTNHPKRSWFAQIERTAAGFKVT